MEIITVGSVCSGIEAASVAWEPLGFQFKWFSEIASFPAAVLKEKYPSIPNLGDMNCIPDAIIAGKVDAPDMICGGTPCQAFSLAGWKNGLNDDRGNLTLRFVDIVDASDQVRVSTGKRRSVVFWENVEGVLTDKTNAFGCLVSSLAGLSDVINCPKWPNAGMVKGPTRNVAWRVLDAKYFGLPQQRRRLYVLAGDTDFHPENVLFEKHQGKLAEYPCAELVFSKDGHKFEVFREYTDCLYSAYGTKWNGNAAANNGSLFVVQDDRIRRLSPLECERLMGFPDRYTDLPCAKKTNRYQATGNSWAVPVVRWIGKKLMEHSNDITSVVPHDCFTDCYVQWNSEEGCYFNFGKDIAPLGNGDSINCTAIPEKSAFGSMEDIVSPEVPEDIYISPTGCFGIVRRSRERKTSINERLREVLLSISSEWSAEAIEERSRVQKRGRFSTSISDKNTENAVLASTLAATDGYQLTLFDIAKYD